jgi:hypothetical protein
MQKSLVASLAQLHHRSLDSEIHVPAVLGMHGECHLSTIEKKRATSIFRRAFSAK